MRNSSLLMALLSAAVESPANAPAVEPREATQRRRSGTRRIEEIAAEHRSRWKKPINRGPRAADVIRAERDAR